MTTLMILAAVGTWSAGFALVIAMCRSAALGDEWRDDGSLERALQPLPRRRPRQRRAPRCNLLRDLERL
jgi:hypothetical protein